MTCRIRGETRLRRHKEGRRTVAAIMCADHKEQLELLDHKRLQSASCLTVVNITPVHSEEDAFCRSFDAAGSSVLLVGNLQSLQTRISLIRFALCCINRLAGHADAEEQAKTVTQQKAFSGRPPQ